MAMCTHRVNLKEDKSAQTKGGPIKPPYLGMRAGGTVQGTLQIVQTNLNVGRRGRRHDADNERREGEGDGGNNVEKPTL